MLRSPSQSGSKGSTSVMYCRSRSCETPKEHSVKNVAFLNPAVREKVRDLELLEERGWAGEIESNDESTTDVSDTSCGSWGTA